MMSVCWLMPMHCERFMLDIDTRWMLGAQPRCMEGSRVHYSAAADRSRQPVA